MNITKPLLGLILTIGLCLGDYSIFAQGPASIWYFGTKAGLDFSGGGTPSKLNNSAMNLGNYNGEGMASISDAAGNLLFYTDGVTVYGSNHAVITGGTGLNGNTSSTQTALIVPVPGSTNLYYIFSTPGEEASAASGTGTADALSGLRYSIVNVTTNSVTTKNVRLTPAGVPITEAQTAVPHYDGTSFWLICKQAGNKTSGAGSNNFYSYRIGTNNITASTGVINTLNGTADEIITAAGRSIPGSPAPPATIASSNGIITMKVNSCFNKLAVAYFSLAKEVQIFNFDNNTGAISLATTVTGFAAGDPNEVYGLEFSPDGSLLYATVMFFNAGSEAVRGKIYQFNSSSGAMTFTHTVAGTTSNGLGALQLGEDGSIYYAFFDNNPTGSGTTTSVLGRIVSPNISGSGANFDDAFMTWTNTGADLGSAVKMGLPQVYRGFLAGIANITSSLSNLQEICLGDNVDFTANTVVPVVSYAWNIDKNFNNVVDYTTGPTINHTYASTGTYTVELKVTDACGYTNTSTSQVKVLPKITSAASVSCLSGGRVQLTVTSPDPLYKYVWYSNSAGTNAIASGTSVIIPTDGSGGTFYLRAESSSSSSASSSSYFPTALDTNPIAASSTNMPFTVNSPVTFTSFDWSTSEINWSTNPTNRSYTISIQDASGTNTLWTNARTVNVYGGLHVFTESPALTLGPGNYRVSITAAGTTNPNSIPSWQTQYSFPYGPSSAVTFTGGGAIPAFLANLNISTTSYTVTSIPCSQLKVIPYSCPLPVTWLGFTAQRTESSAVLLNWATASEQNSALFEVQRSSDGVNFETIGQVNAAGNSNSLKAYAYTDFDAPEGNVYYRLLQKDIDGAFTYSKIVHVNGSGALSLSLVPNPGNGSFTIIGLSGDTKLDVAVYSITGQSLYTTATYPGQLIDLGDLAKGFYVVRITSGNSEQSIRYINQ